MGRGPGPCARSVLERLPEEAALGGGVTGRASPSAAGRLQIEQVSQLSALVDAQLDYHRQAVQILDELADKLKRR